MTTSYRILFIYFFIGSCFNDAYAISIEQFYPYGIQNNDWKLEPNDDSSSGRIPISVLFPFFQEKYDSLYVNTNGVISFRGDLQEFTPEQFPVANDRRLVAPFWADVNTRNGGEVFYRETTDLKILQKATNDIKKYFPSPFFKLFRVSWAFVATWYNVSYFMKNRTSTHLDQKRNTFQTVLVTNGRHSFAIFLYNKIDWTSGEASTGVSGAQAGFNYGDGIRYYSIRGSLTDLVNEFPMLSNVNVPGVFSFRLDEARISEGGCNTAGGIIITPRQGVVLGGTEITISGPCFEKSTDKIVCRFNGTTVQGNIDSNYVARCVTPALKQVGKITLELSTHDGKSFDFSTIFYSVPLGRHGPGVSGLLSKDWINHVDPLFLAWNPSDIRTKSARIEVAKFDWKTMELLDQTIVIEQNISNYGFHTIQRLLESANQMPHPANKFSNEYFSPLAIISINSEKPERGSPTRIFSAPFLAFPNNGNISGEVKKAYDQLGIPVDCRKWFSQQDQDHIRSLRDELLSCPRSIEQAMADIGRFVSDDECKPPRTLACRVYHNGSYHCFKSLFPSIHGAGQQCCYTKQGNLVVGPSGGGTLDKYHAASSRYATLKHLKEDVYTWYMCCRNSDSCDAYYQARPSDDGAAYRPPQIATTFGDPHFVTLDGVEYTFNGYGEYIMVVIEDNGFIFQARMQPQGDISQGTFLTAFALKENQSDIIQIEMNDLQLIDVFVNGDLETFDIKKPDSILQFNGVILTQQKETRVIQIIFETGIVVTVEQNEISLSFNMLLPDTFKGKTKGLLGLWDDDKNNDFTLPDGQTLSVTSKSSSIHYDFGQKWLTRANESLFIYHEDKTHSNFVNNEYKPMFMDEMNAGQLDKVLHKNALETCGNVKECWFDVISTGSTDFGNSTRHSLEEFEAKKKLTTIVHVPDYYNCFGAEVQNPCDACGKECIEYKEHNLVIVLAVSLFVIAILATAMLLLHYMLQKRPRKRQDIGNEGRKIRERPRSEATSMVFVLPQLESETHVNS